MTACERSVLNRQPMRRPLANPLTDDCRIRRVESMPCSRNRVQVRLRLPRGSGGGFVIASLDYRCVPAGRD